jgi:hypothetical protein
LAGMFAVVAAGLAVSAASCQPPPPPGAVVMALAGDIACKPGSAVATTTCQQANTAALVTGDSAIGVVQTLGDNQYENGLLAEYQQSYAASWGTFKAKTHPAPGNHEYQSTVAPNGEGYYGYFGAAAHGPYGFYSYDVGSWHVVVLNSECTKVSCLAGDGQEVWLRSDLAGTRQPCIMAVTHHPRYTSGPVHDDTALVPMYQDLLNAHADLMVSGHDHDYERFAPQGNASNATASGITQLVVGTGGKSQTGLGLRETNSVVGNGRVFGILRLTLSSNGWSGRFVPDSAAGYTFTDSFSGTCH